MANSNQNWWEAAPLEKQSGGGNWWEAAPLASDSLPDAPDPTKPAYTPDGTLIPPPPPYNESRDNKGDFMRGFESALKGGMPENVAGTLDIAAIKSPFGGQMLKSGAQSLRDTAAKNDVLPKYNSFSDVHGVGDFIDMMQEQVGSGVASMIPPLVGGAAGTAIGTASPVPFAGPVLGAAGTFSGSAVQNYGELFNALKNEASSFNKNSSNKRKITDEELADLSLKYGSAISAVDAIPLARTGKRVAGEFAKEVAGLGIKDTAKKILGEYVKGFAEEGATEASQEAIKQKALADTFGTSYNPDSIMFAGVGGGAAGGAMRGVPATVTAPFVKSEAQSDNPFINGDNERGNPTFTMTEAQDFVKSLSLPAPEQQLSLPSPEMSGVYGVNSQGDAEQLTQSQVNDNYLRSIGLEPLLPQPEQRLALPSPKLSGEFVAGRDGIKPLTEADSMQKQQRLAGRDSFLESIGLEPDMARYTNAQKKIAKKEDDQRKAEATRLAELEQAKAEAQAQGQPIDALDTEMANVAKSVVSANQNLVDMTKKGKPAKQPKRPDLLQFIAHNGGLRDEGGELRQMDAHKKFIPAAGKLVRPKGMTLDQARELAQEAGYGDYQTTNDLLDAIDNSMRGNRIFQNRQIDDTMQAEQDLQAQRYADTEAQYTPEEIAQFQQDSHYRNRADELGIEQAGRDIEDVTYDVLEREAIQAEANGLPYEAADGYNSNLYGDIPFDDFVGDAGNVGNQEAGAGGSQAGKNETGATEPATGVQGQGSEGDTGARPDGALGEETVDSGSQADSGTAGQELTNVTANAAQSNSTATQSGVPESSRAPAADEPNAARGVEDKPVEYGNQERASTSAIERTQGDIFTVRPNNDLNSNNDVSEVIKKSALQGETFQSITQARKYISDKTGDAAVKGGTIDAKDIDEQIEVGFTKAAREIVQSSKDDAKTLYDKLVKLHNQQPNLNVRTSTSKENQAYSTPAPIAYLASNLAEIKPSDTVYEPAAGHGMLLIGANDKNAFANELDPNRVKRLQQVVPNALVSNENALDFDLGQKVDVIIANPPFGKIRDKQGSPILQKGGGLNTTEIDHAIVLKSLESLKDKGRAVFIIGGKQGDDNARSTKYNSKTDRAFWKRLYGNYNVTDHFSINGDLYNKQGAGWPLDVIVINGKGKSALSFPAVNLPRKYDSFDSLKELINETGSNEGVESVQKAGSTRLGSDKLQNDSRLSGLGGNNNSESRQDDSAIRRPVSGDRRESSQAREYGVASTEATDTGSGGTTLVEQRDDTGSNKQGAAEQGLPTENKQDYRNETSRARDDAQRLPVSSGADGDKVGLGEPKKRTNNEKETSYQVKVDYSDVTNAKEVGTLVPVNMRGSLSRALTEIKQAHGNIDKFVADALGYKNADDMLQYFSAEQVTALAMAIDNLENNSGFIIGDQTGVGKGRFVAGIIRYAKNAGRMPIFVTENPPLYADMYRDTKDIGMEKFNAFPTNSDLKGKKAIHIGDGRMVASPEKGKYDKIIDDMAAYGKMPAGYDAIFTNYSQMQTVKGKAPKRVHALEAIAPKSIIILDESHNAGGQKGGFKLKDPETGEEIRTRASIIRDLVDGSAGTVYSSATFAKNPDVMDLYRRTDMAKAVDKLDDLTTALQAGGVPLQQIASSMLVERGQYRRAERSYDGVEMGLITIETDIKAADDATDILRKVYEFDLDMQDVIGGIKEDLKADAKALGTDTSKGTAGINSVNFTSVMHNLVNQMMLSLNARAAAQQAVNKWKEGKRIVVAVSNTFETLLNGYVKDTNTQDGDSLGGLDFGEVFRRYLIKTREYTIASDKNNNEQKERIFISDKELPDDLLKRFKQIENEIKRHDFSALPVSPIDAMHQVMRDAGMNTSEITGRSIIIDYSKDKKSGTLSKRDNSVAGKLRSIDGFNNKDIDALIINSSGSTGISLHASEKFKNQSPRHMMVVQPDPNIDTFMQMLGRIHRTGQVKLPSYDIVVSNLPPAKRMAANLMRKMASLNANTTANRNSAVSINNVVDFMNMYGDKVVADVLSDDTELAAKLDLPSSYDAGSDMEGLANKMTGRLAILPVKDQEEIYNVIEKTYNEEMARLEAMGENALEAKTLELDAVPTGRREVIRAGEGDSGNPFTAPAYLEQFDVRRLGKPYTPDQVTEIIEKTTNGDADAYMQLHKSSIAEKVGLREKIIEKKAQEAQNKIDSIRSSNIEEEKASKAISRLHDDIQKYNEELKNIKDTATEVRKLVNTTPIGSAVRVSDGEIDGDHYVGIVIGHEYKNDKPGLPLSKAKIKIAVTDASKEIIIPYSKAVRRGSLEPRYKITGFDGDKQTVLNMMASGQSESREKRWIATGNLLAGFAKMPKGQIVFFQRKDGTTERGILMGRSFEAEAELSKIGEPFDTPEQIAEFVDRVLGENRTASIKSLDGNAEIVATPRGEYYISAKNKGGAPFYMNKNVRSKYGDYATTRGRGVWRLNLHSVSDIKDVSRIYEEEIGARFEAATDKDMVQAIKGKSKVLFSRPRVNAGQSDNSALISRNGKQAQRNPENEASGRQRNGANVPRSKYQHQQTSYTKRFKVGDYDIELETLGQLTGAGQKLVQTLNDVGAADGDVRFSEGRDITKTEAFKKWFGDSKVVDENGEPLVVYHGTDEGYLRAFRDDFQYFSASGDVASGYARGAGANSFPNVIPAYLSLQKPLVVDAKGSNYDSISYDGGKYWTVDALAVIAKDGGYDSLIVRNVIDEASPKENAAPSTVYVAFRPTQIKSAIGSDFNPDSPLIGYSVERIIATKPESLELAKKNLTEFEAKEEAVTDAGFIEIKERLKNEPDATQKITDTPAFKKWFGNSKVVDENGEPLVVYHGTSKDIEDFRKSPDKTGFYFTKDPDVANTYARRSVEGNNVTPVYLSIKNPYIFDAEGAPFAGINVAGEFFSTDELSRRIESVFGKGHDGNDGIIFKNIRDNASKNQNAPVTDVYVAFSPTQIKSIHNKGMFDPNNPRILFSRPRVNAGQSDNSALISRNGKQAQRNPENEASGRQRNGANVPRSKYQHQQTSYTKRFKVGDYDIELETLGQLTGAGQKLVQTLNDVAAKTFGKSVDIEFAKAIRANGTSVNGLHATVENFIKVVLDKDNAAFTLNHEGIHFLRTANVFGKRWKALEKRAKERWIDEYDIRDRYAEDNLNESGIMEEAIADAYADYATGNMKFPTGIKSIFFKLKQFFERLGNALRGMGYNTAEDVFKDIQAGKYAVDDVGAADGDVRFSKGRDITKTEAFKKWFGDSKVVDENGEPLVVYKGMYPYDWTQETADGPGPEIESINRTTEFPAFNRGEEGLNIAGFFGGKETANHFAEIGNAGAVYPVYLNIRKPWVYDAGGTEMSGNTQFGESGSDFRDAMRSGKYDGAIIKNTADEGTIYVALKPEQIKSAISNNGNFDPNDPRILFSRARENVDAGDNKKYNTGNQKVREENAKEFDIISRITTDAPDANWLDKIKSLPQRMRDVLDSARDRNGAIIKHALSDQFAAIEAKEVERYGKLLDASVSAYKMSRMTKGSPKLFQLAMGIKTKDGWLGGQIRYNKEKGTTEIVPNTKPLMAIFEPIAKQGAEMVQLWEGWAIANRSQRLMKEGRENLLKQEDIDTLLKLEDKYPEFRKALDAWTQFNQSVLDMAETSGIIDPQSRKLWASNDYVPFYRVLEDEGGFQAMMNRMGLQGQRSGIKGLKGGEEKIGSVMENMMRNVSHLMDASVKNIAMQRIDDLFQDSEAWVKPEISWKPATISPSEAKKALNNIGVETDSIPAEDAKNWLKVFTLNQPKEKDVISFMRDGKPEYRRVNDPLLLSAVTKLGAERISWIMNMLGAPKRWLTTGVTATPTFMARNAIRDTVSTMITQGVDMKHPIEAAKAYRDSLRNDPDKVRMLASGAGFYGYYQAQPKGFAKKLKHFGKDRTTIDTAKDLWDAWGRVGEASEQMNRLALYRNLIDKGATEAEAAYQARDLLDFQMQGANAAVQFLIQTVPFMNPRIQGLYKLGRAAAENPKRFAARGALLMAATIALWAANKDDERYKDLQEWDKDSNYHFWIGDQHFTLPKPFEVGALFSTLPERALNSIYGIDRERVTLTALGKMITDTFAFDPTPQLFKPLIEDYANKDSFTGRDIVPMGREGAMPEAQFTDYTSKTAINLADALPDFFPDALRSPARLEHLLQGYFGAIPASIFAGTDAAIGTLSNSPEKASSSIDRLPIVRAFYRDDKNPRSTKWVSEYYDLRNETEAIYRAINVYKKTGDIDKAKKILSEKAEYLRVRPVINSINKSMTSISQSMDAVNNSKILNADEKRKRINALMNRRNSLAKRTEKILEKMDGIREEKMLEDKAITTKPIPLSQIKQEDPDMFALMNRVMPYRAEILNAYYGNQA